MKLFITGGAGFVGSNMLTYLDSNKDVKNQYSEIFVVDKNSENIDLLKKLFPDYSYIHADLSQKGKWQDMIHSDVVVLHLAAQIASDKREDFELNCVRNTQLILETMKNNGCERIFFFSSAAVLSSRKDWYAETKAESENLVVKSGLQYDIIRPSMMYGPFDNKNVGFLIQFMKKIPVFPVPGNGKYPRQPVFVGDVCQYVFSIFQQPASNNIVGLNGEVVNYIDMVTNIKKNIGLKSIIIKLPIWLFISLMVIYNTITRKVLFTPDQVKSLTSGDVFEDEDWWSAHNLERTSFPKGISKIRESKYFGYVLKR